ncbi:hypothetical protein L7F22_001360 [Adiantum nelumboides]|nr:hypothetical protein [Adiantum nelumboides]
MTPKRVGFGGVNDHEAETSNSKGKGKAFLVEEPEKTPVADQVPTDSQGDHDKIIEVLSISFSIAICCYAILGVIGVLMFGDSIKSQVTLNMPRHLLASKVAIWATVATPITKFSLLLSPVASEMEAWCLDYFKLKERSLGESIMSKAIRAMLLGFIVLVAFALPYFGYVIELVGSAMTATICMILPCIFYLRCHQEQKMTRRQIVELYFLITISAVVGLLGTYLSFKGLIASKLNS